MKEGGNAVSGVSRINQLNVASTLEALFSILLQKLKLQKKDIATLGSTGKKAPLQSSGDIDIAIDAKALLKSSGQKTLDSVYDYLLKVAKELSSTDVKDGRGLGTISFAFPISNTDGQQPKSLVQIDLFVVDSMDYAGWIYYGPHYTESQLKGVYRNILLAQVAKYASLKIIKTQDGTDVTREKLVFNFAKGLMKNTESKEGKKGLLKNFKTIDSQLVSQNPDEISKILFGDGYRGSDLLTFESVLAAVLSPTFPYSKSRKEIIMDTKKILLELGYPIPEILANVK